MTLSAKNRTKGAEGGRFHCLPFRVVLEIFPFVEVEAPWRSRKRSFEFEFFGRFHADRNRKPFFLFRSLKVEPPTDTLIDFSQVENLKIIGSLKYFSATDRFFKNLITDSPSIGRLRKLVIQNYRLEPNLFTRKNCFSALEVFEYRPLVSNSRRNPNRWEAGGSRKWHIASHVWQNIRKIVIDFPYDTSKSLSSPIFKNEFKNAVSVDISCLEPSEKVTLQLPKATSLSLRKCRNIKLVAPLLSSLKCLSVDTELANSLLVDTVTKFEYQASGNDLDWLLSGGRLANIRELTILGVTSFPSAQMKKVEKLESLKIVNGGQTMFDDNLLDNNFTSLTKLIIHLGEFRADRVFSFCPILREFRISYSNEFSNDFFLRNRFDCLEVLELRTLMNRYGKDWVDEDERKMFPKLRELYIIDVSNFNVEVFQNVGFESLEVLVIEIHSHFTDNINRDNSSETRMISWKPETTRNLRKLEIVGCWYLRCIFQEPEKHPLEKLEELLVYDSDLPVQFLHRRLGGWKCRLRILRLANVLVFGGRLDDRLFQAEGEDDDSWMNLRELELIAIRSVTGRGWKYLPKLERLEVRKNQDFGFGRKKPFREDIVTYKVSWN